MKKTIAILLAAAGIAMGAGADLTIDNKENNANSSYEFNSTTIEATVAINLNLKNLLALEDSATIFTLEGPHTGGERDVMVGLGIDVTNKGSYMDALTASGFNWNYLDIELENTLIKQAEYGIVTFTLNQHPDTGKVTLSELLFLYDKNGKMLTLGAYSGMYRQLYSANYGSFTFFNMNKDFVYEAQVYNSILDDEAQYSLADEMIASYLANSSPAAPEPTTATLSLLALAGLAARRRRR